MRLTAGALEGSYIATIQVADHRLWDTHDPYLYTLTVSLDPDDAGMEDDVSLRFGFREYPHAMGKILLNGEPIFLLSALDQDMYPDTSTQCLRRSSSATSFGRPRSWA